MRLLIVRHAIAQDREEFARTGESDDQRPLTSEGRWRMSRVAKGLRDIVPEIDVLATSPFVRTMQTAAIIADAYDLDEDSITTLPALAPDGKADTVVRWLAKQEADLVALVGHEPDLGRLVVCLVTGESGDWLPLRKGGACLLEFEERPRAGGAEIRWLLPPALLRRLRD